MPDPRVTPAWAATNRNGRIVNVGGGRGGRMAVFRRSDSGHTAAYAELVYPADEVAEVVIVPKAEWERLKGKDAR